MADGIGMSKFFSAADAAKNQKWVVWEQFRIQLNLELRRVPNGLGLSLAVCPLEALDVKHQALSGVRLTEKVSYHLSR